MSFVDEFDSLAEEDLEKLSKLLKKKKSGAKEKMDKKTKKIRSDKGATERRSHCFACGQLLPIKKREVKI